MSDGLRLLFVKHSLAWPRSSGHDVHCFHMMKALAELGAQISLVTAAEPDPRAIAGISFACRAVMSGDEGDRASGPAPRLTPLQERFRSYFGIDRNQIATVATLAASSRADAVVVVGFDDLPFLAGVTDAVRVWYAADEWVYHHLSSLRASDVSSWQHVKHAAIKGLYERAYRSLVDRIWVVSDTERRAARWFAGMKIGDVVPLGVDAEFYQPLNEPEIPSSAVFWGRLDFGPNVEALSWFCSQVWPTVKRDVPGARFTIIGFEPCEQVRQLAQAPGISLIPDVEDLRPLVSRHEIVVMPFVSGGGMKNKLLEAAALARPIVCTARACTGLRSSARLPVIAFERARDWSEQLPGLWADPGRRRRLGAEARQWVIEQHSWPPIAREALTALEAALRQRRAVDSR